MPHRFSDVSICATYTKTLIMSNVLETKNALKKKSEICGVFLYVFKTPDAHMRVGKSVTQITITVHYSVEKAF